MSEENKISKSLPIKSSISFVSISGDDISFEVKKLPLGKIIDLLNAIEQLPKEVANLDKMDESEILQNISVLIAVSLPKFVDVIVKAIDDAKITRELILNEFGADDIINTVFAILSVNNVLGIMETLKKVQALMKPKAKMPQVVTG